MGDAVDGEHARLALLSTSNTALADLIGGRPEVQEAAQSRMITIRIERDAPHGVFESLPYGYTSGRAVSEDLTEAVNSCWGAAGRAFVERLVREAETNEDRLKRDIAKRLDRYMRLDRTEVGSARVQKTFALVTVAAGLARQWRILPRAWGWPLGMIQAVARNGQRLRKAHTRDGLAKVQDYVKQHRSALVKVAGMAGPLTKAAFEATAGFVRQVSGGTEVLIPAAQFQAAFPDYETLLRALRTKGLARTEGGRTPKLSIKTPRAICAEGRVYCIRIA